MQKGLLKPIAIVAVGVVVVVVIVCGLALSGVEVEGQTPKQRIASICRLADEQPWGAGDAIILAGSEDPDPTVRRTAMIALGRFRGEDYRLAVEAGMKDTSGLVRQGAALTLGMYGYDGAVAKLGELMATDPDEQVRAAAATGLGRIRRSDSIALLAVAMAESDSLEVRQHAMQAISNRYNITWTSLPDPRDPAGWAEAVKIVYAIPGVNEALGGPVQEQEGVERP